MVGRKQGRGMGGTNRKGEKSTRREIPFKTGGFLASEVRARQSRSRAEGRHRLHHQPYVKPEVGKRTRDE